MNPVPSCVEPHGAMFWAAFQQNVTGMSLITNS